MEVRPPAGACEGCRAHVTGRSCPWFHRTRKPSFQEWLETDGMGGFASSTFWGIHTRRYHGWLFVAGLVPGERYLVLSKVEEIVRTPDGDWELGANFYPGVVHPRGLDHMVACECRPHPAFLYRTGHILLEREIFMVRGRPGVFVVYRMREGPADVHLLLKPLMNSRHYHELGREGRWSPQVSPTTVEGEDGPVWILLEPHACGKPVAVWLSRGEFRPDPVWYRSMVYPREEERGLDFSEDHFCPGEFSVALSPGREVYLWAGPVDYLPSRSLCGGGTDLLLEDVKSREAARRLRVCGQGGGGVRGRLCLAAEDFLVETSDGQRTIVAGYHWFGEWGRDAFISLPGLLLASGRYAEARSVFLRFAGTARYGLIPNFIGPECAYNSADAALWFIVALGKYLNCSGDRSVLRELWSVIKDIVGSFIRGTAYGIEVTSSGLLKAGSPDTQITWMDAKVGGVPVTPRDGYPVEINSLWLSSLELVSEWAREMGDGLLEGQTRNLLTSATAAFLGNFRWPGVGLYDRLAPDGSPVTEIRPNAVIAASLPGFPGGPEILEEVAATAVRFLVTPYGLRTLDPRAPAYRGRYAGGPEERDRAYHQGTAWPWLLGPLMDVMRKIARTGPATVVREPEAWGRFLVARLADLDSHPCAGTVFEVCSGDPPFTPGGAVAQAWSVAELLRIITGLDMGNLV